MLHSRSNNNEIKHLHERCFRIVYQDKQRDIVPAEVKNAISLNSFKAQIKKWLLFNCPCRICKPYINGVGFL